MQTKKSEVIDRLKNRLTEDQPLLSDIISFVSYFAGDIRDAINARAESIWAIDDSADARMRLQIRAHGAETALLELKAEFELLLKSNSEEK